MGLIFSVFLLVVFSRCNSVRRTYERILESPTRIKEALPELAAIPDKYITAFFVHHWQEVRAVPKAYIQFNLLL